ncbi:hypothetical protein G6F70_000376 [Rhizopus microsporus]|uniref:Myb-like domain-containing protein n=1 Tax=Rhizopus microsporus TaxID=58291 RepID=A0A1X0S9E9_RHIZD|nr:hypothetical protein G6F71_000394 [Rhizopus microsporus]KAG1204522.1 hypothetical protein G6F70_000376 [Rhizopus microsporus]KAG1216024.1 hypothetical protein G6F69_000451 [Rhizopus microsporus]KAG1238595.1 hypothetical protein G6F67_000288 [Rhizopus microsporus]KAG1269546.1 hypothetical protein G6F68_000170 [Rhizopus microsporus]
MDVKNLLNDTVELYEKRDFDYGYTSPSMSWSSASSISSSDTVPSSPTAFPGKLKEQQQQTRIPWTVAEDYLLQKGYLQGLSWAMISAKYLPHRSRGCCWGRFKTLRAKNSQRKGWSVNEDRILLSSIKKNTHLFKQAWRSVALDLNNRDWKECELRSACINLINHQVEMP